MAITMLYYKYIEDMFAGNEIEGFYLLKDAMLKTSSNGKPFLAGSISDKTGSIDFKVWDYTGPVGTSGSDIGKVVKVRGSISEFKGSLQMIITNIRLAGSGDSVDTSRLVPTAPIDSERTLSEIAGMIDSLEDDDYRKLAQTMFERHRDAFAKIPAAKSFHHSFVSGLLMHTADMLRAADFLARLYDEVIDRSLLMTGVLLHDLAKESEFTFSELGVVTDYSVKGQLLGHLVMGAEEVAETAKELGIPETKSVLLQHLILSHHGEPEFGAAVRPLCAEAELLSYIDVIDSRMEIYAENLPDVPVGGFSARIPALDKKIHNHE